MYSDEGVSTLLPVHSEEQAIKAQVLAGGGEVGALMRDKDWSETALGPVSTWPQSLLTTVSICLHSRFELFTWWGPELLMLYNDAYRQTLMSKHPWALGRPGREVWPEIWPIIGPMLERVLQKGEATRSDDLLLILERHGYPEETYHTFSYSPILEEAGRIGGVFTAVQQTTDKVIGERRLRTLSDLGARSANASTSAEAWRLAAETLGQNAYDIPFAVLYALDDNGIVARAKARTGISETHPALPPEIHLEDPEGRCATLIIRAISENVPLEIDNAESLAFPGGAWETPSCQVVILPLAQTGQAHPLGVLVAGISPRKRLDSSYRDFLDIVAAQVARSIADAQSFERERERAEALAALDRAKTAFFSNISHEFRTPLTLMLGTLEEMLQEPADTQDRERVTVAHRNALRLLKLVNTLLDFSRIEAGRMSALYQPVDLAALTRDLASSFRSAIERAGLAFMVECPELSEPAYIDRDMWEKIVLNLLSNAYKFTFNGSISVRLGETPSAFELSVADSGTGIPPAELPRIFERFHRVEGARGRTHEGTGIGLALVHDLVKLHGGAVRAESEPGCGSTFHVSIPKGQAHVQMPMIESPAEAQQSFRAEIFVEEAENWLPIGDELPIPAELAAAPETTARILIADDNADMRGYLRRLLAPHYSVTAVTNGRDAFDIALTQPPDLILTDVMMPVLDGFWLLQEIRNNDSTRGVPVIMLSARAGEEARVQGLEAGADDYLVKPFTTRELLARVAAHIKMARLRRDAAEHEDALKREIELERNRLRDTFHLAPAAIAITSGPDHIYTFVNAPYVRLIGRQSADQCLGRSVRDVLSELSGSISGNEVLFRLDEVFRTGVPFQAHEWRIPLNRAQSGQPELGYFNFVFQPALTISGQVEGTLTYAIEVTEQVRTRQKTEEREQLLEVAQHAASAGSFGWDLRTDEMFWTEGFRALHRLPATLPATLESYTNHIHPEDSEGALTRLRHSIESGQERYENEYRTLLSDGSIRWIASRGRFIVEDGVPVRYVGTHIDITQRKLTEDALRKTEKLAVTGRLAASIAHEINNPLEAIMNIVYLLTAKSEMDDEAKRYLALAQQELTRVSNIVTQTLRFYRQSSGPALCHFDEIMDSVLSMHNGRVLSAHIAVIRDYRPTPPLTCFSGELRQVFANLVGNAIDAMPEGGTLRVRIREIQQQNGATAVCVTVADTGTGIPENVLPHIFEPFVTTKEATGTGLGLWVSLEIIQKHRGSIRVRSRTAGRHTGTAFRVVLPYEGAKLADVSSEPASSFTKA